MGTQSVGQPLTAAHLRASSIINRTEPGDIVAELGVWDGRLSELLAKADRYVLMVDTWAPRDFRPDSYVSSGDPRALATDGEMERARQRARARMFGLPHGSQRMDTVQAAAYHKAGSIDLVFIDADHSYEGVSADIKAWLPAVKSGGWIGGHDFGDPNYPGVERAVREAFPDDRIELGCDRTWFVRL